jgi:hypothetical protein
LLEKTYTKHKCVHFHFTTQQGPSVVVRSWLHSPHPHFLSLVLSNLLWSVKRCQLIKMAWRRRCH